MKKLFCFAVIILYITKFAASEDTNGGTLDSELGTKASIDIKFNDVNNYEDEDDDNNYPDEDDDDYEPDFSLQTINSKSKKKSKPKSGSKPVQKSKNSNSLKKQPSLKDLKLSEEADTNSNEITELKKPEIGKNKLENESNEYNTLCTLKLNYDISKKNEPLFMVKDDSGVFHLAFPNLVEKEKDKCKNEITAIQFGEEENIYLECPGKNNRLNGGDRNDDTPASMKCINGSRVSLHVGKVDKPSDSSQLTCVKPVTGSAKFSAGKKPCGNGEGTLVELGFQAEGWHKLIDVCFNVKEIKTLYAKHKLYGSVLAGAVVDSNRPKFSRGQDDFYRGFNPDEYYKQANEKRTILKLTGDEKYFNPADNLYLARGHFAPDADFIFKAWQDLTYFFVNVAPQWQSINQGHWLSVERLARNIAMKLEEDLDIVTGSYGVMEISGKQLYLNINEDKKNGRKREYIPELAVPDYYWKLIHRPKNNECIVLISTNNPFIDEPKEFCKDICEENSWPTLKDSKKGFVSCCDYNDFLSTVTFIPEYNCTGGILQGP